MERAAAAFSAHDPDGFVALMTEDVIIEHSAAPAPMHGRAEVTAFYTNMWRGYPDLTLELMDGLVLPSTRPTNQPELARSGHPDRAARPTGPRAPWQARGVRRSGDRRNP
ncbi:nuclear transport factor 2 family protein [Mycolicibacterium xanthum]|uniref:nuclear transport factor 2 family protein n=1 Tax=Mycolicibacterium xanthum TaxID=2796469 RepID=UPI0035561546